MRFKLIVSLVALLCLGAAFVLIEPFGAESEGAIRIIVQENETVLVDEWQDFYEGDSLYDVLKRHYDIETSDRYASQYGRTLLAIDEVRTDFESSFIHISVDGTRATRGIDHIPLHDGSEYRFEVRRPR